MDTIIRMVAKVKEKRATKGIYVALLGVVLALFALDSVSSLVLRGNLSGSIANAQSFAEPADESSSDADVGTEPDLVQNVAGTWNGPITDSVFGDGTLTVTIRQKTNAASLKGTWTITFVTGPVTIDGTIKGREKNGTGMLDLKRKSRHHGTCHVKAMVTVPDATHMNGTYMTTGGCGQQSTGNFMLTMP